MIKVGGNQVDQAMARVAQVWKVWKKETKIRRDENGGDDGNIKLILEKQKRIERKRYW
jgi:hypothetical protein